ncbi:hypothetical protein M885DRAFT_529128 [Pelagophyceae sp. CCMP2097]|nr:hypothetical protein M885DRAFT_529128 [Pelagophyceae sp. CCMP2097]
MVFIYGDASRRIQFMLPRTLKDLVARCEAHFGWTCELYHDASQKGGLYEDSTGAYRVRNETDFAFIQEGDIVVVTDPNGRRIDLENFFDGITTHQHDYVEHPLQNRAPLPNVRPVDVAPLPDVSALTYATTYQREYTPKTGYRDAGADADPNVPRRQTSATGRTTYQNDYVSKTREDLSLEAPYEMGERRPWIQDYTSTYKKDFLENAVERVAARPLGAQPPYDSGAPWRPTEYTDEYVPRQAKRLGVDDGYDSKPVDGYGNTDWRSSYERDYVEHNVRRGPIYADPERNGARAAGLPYHSRIA